MLMVDTEGWINSIKIKKEHKPAIEHGLLSSVKAIVLHRTGSGTAKSVLNAWDTKKSGTHFLISETGKVYQTASLKRKCWHVGKLYSKCRVLSSCSKADAAAIEGILHAKNSSWGKKFKAVTRHELKKSYPLRFPHNHDSVGIEIVGMINKKSEIYEIPNRLQLDSLFWLLNEIIAIYGVTMKDIYAHGQIAHKDRKKTEGLASLKAYTIHRGG